MTTTASDYKADAFSVLGFEAIDADPTRDKPDFGAYSPSEEMALREAREYAHAFPKIHFWAIIDNATKTPVAVKVALPIPSRMHADTLRAALRAHENNLLDLVTRGRRERWDAEHLDSVRADISRARDMLRDMGAR